MPNYSSGLLRKINVLQSQFDLKQSNEALPEGIIKVSWQEKR